MLIGPPPPTPLVGNECAVPGGYICGSRGSAMFSTCTMGIVGSVGTVVECKCLNAVMQATGSSCEIITISAPGVDPELVVTRQSTVDTAILPALNRFPASVCIATQVSSDAYMGIPSVPAMNAALSA